MQCVHCGKIIRDNSLNCPYCGKPVKEDYFGYQRAEQQARSRQQNPPKKDNSGKIILIVFGVLGGVFALVLMLVFLLSSGSGGSTATMQYDGSFTIAPDCIFSVTDTGNTGMYTIYTRLDGDQVHIETVDAGEELHYLFEEGNYQMRVEKTTGESIMLQMTVSSGCIYNTATLEFDKRQIQTTNGGNTQITDAELEDVYYFPSKRTVYQNGVKGQVTTIAVNDSGQIIETIYSNEPDCTSKNVLTLDNSHLSQVECYYQSSASSPMELDSRYFLTYDGENLTAMKCERSDDSYPVSATYSYENGKLSKSVKTFSVGADETHTTFYSYDDAGNLLSKYTYLNNSIESSFYTINTYDANNRQTKQYYKSNESGNTESVEFEYSDGLVSKKTGIVYFKDTDFDMDDIYFYTYNDNLQLVKVEEDRQGHLYAEETMAYTADGLPAKMTLTVWEVDETIVKEIEFSDYISLTKTQKKAMDDMAFIMEGSENGYEYYQWIDPMT